MTLNTANDISRELLNSKQKVEYLSNQLNGQIGGSFNKSGELKKSAHIVIDGFNYTDTIKGAIRIDYDIIREEMVLEMEKRDVLAKKVEEICSALDEVGL